MTARTSIKLALAAIGLFVWAYAVRVDDPRLRWVGIGFLAAALAVRFWGRRRPPTS